MISKATGADPWGAARSSASPTTVQHSHIIPFWNQGGPGSPPSPRTRTSPRRNTRELCGVVVCVSSSACTVRALRGHGVQFFHRLHAHRRDGIVERRDRSRGGVRRTLHRRAQRHRHVFRGGDALPDGRCKTLDASADGYVRGEAMGVLVLEAMLADRIRPVACRSRPRR